NLTWEANDTLNRTLLYTLYVNTSGGDPLDGPPLVVNASVPWFIIELESGAQVSWAVEVRPLHGPVSLLGSSTFTVDTGPGDGPIAVLSVDGVSSGQRVVVEALEPVTFDGTGSVSDGGVLEFLFDYGDGTSSGWVDTPTVEHTYLKEGDYNATLTVRLVDGPASDPVTMPVRASPGDTTSDEEVPGPGAALSTLALLLVALVALSRSEARRRGGEGR
ncbi:MAG: PKD domain-containing protein, partial [Thermoplasmata archaeon]